MSHDVLVSTAQEALDALADLAEELSGRFEARVRALGLTSLRARALFELAAEGAQRQRALAASLGVSAQQVAVLVDGLIERGLVSRAPDPADRRAVQVSLTDEGAALAARIAELRGAMAEHLLGDAEPAELDLVVALAARVRQRLPRA